MLRPVPVRRTLTQTDTGGPLTATTYLAQLRHCHSTLLLLHRCIFFFSPAFSLLSDWNYTFFSQINIACGPDSCLELFLRKNLFDVWTGSYFHLWWSCFMNEDEYKSSNIPNWILASRAGVNRHQYAVELFPVITANDFLSELINSQLKFSPTRHHPLISFKCWRVSFRIVLKRIRI